MSSLSVKETVSANFVQWKHVAKTDYVYRDDKGILAWLDIRDSDLYKFDDDTKMQFLSFKGMWILPVEMRLEAWSESSLT